MIRPRGSGICSPEQRGDDSAVFVYLGLHNHPEEVLAPPPQLANSLRVEVNPASMRAQHSGQKVEALAGPFRHVTPVSRLWCHDVVTAPSVRQRVAVMSAGHMVIHPPVR